MQETTKLKYGQLILLSLVIVLVVLNILSPLRMTTDSFRYLNIMEYLDGNLGSGSIAAGDFYPHGYPRLLQLLNRCHLLDPAVLVALNIMSVVGSAYLFTRLFPVKNSLLFFSVVLLSFINIKHITLPVADQLFTFILLAATLCVTKAFAKGYIWLLPAGLLTVIAIYLRTAGIILPVAVVLYLLYLAWQRLKGKRNAVLVAVSAVILLMAGLVFILVAFSNRIAYLAQLDLKGLSKSPADLLLRLRYHFTELGEMAGNIPGSQLKSHIHSIDIDYAIAGVFILYLVAKRVMVLKLYTHLPFWLFLSYLAMIFVWPYYDSRFLIPFIPFGLYCLFPQFYVGKKPFRFKLTWLYVFVVLGFISLSYSGMLSLSRNQFLKHYGNDAKLTEVYRQHFESKGNIVPDGQDDHDVMSRTLYLLNKYDK